MHSAAWTMLLVGIALPPITFLFKINLAPTTSRFILVTFVGATLTATTAGKPMQMNSRRRAICGYDTRGLRQPRCPESGARF